MTVRTSSVPIIERLAVLSDPLRLRMLRVLESEELSVGEVGRVLRLPQSTASRHLKALGEAGWVTRRHAGTSAYYGLAADDLDEPARVLWAAVRGQLRGWTELEEDDERLRAVLAERMNNSRAFFGRLAGQWDDVRRELFGDHFLAPALLGLLPRTWVVADLGCGTGNVAGLIAPAVEHVIAVDREPAMLEAARLRLSGVGNVAFVAGELESLPLEDGSVDAAVCSLVLHHAPDPSEVVGEMARVLRRDRGGGVALIVEMLRHDRHEYRREMGHRWLGFGEEELSGLLTGAGFAPPTLSPLPPESGSSGPRLVVARAELA